MSHPSSTVKNPERIRRPIPVTPDGLKSILQDDASYPEGWDLEHFKNLPSFKKRVEYAREKLGHIGSGSSRVVFEVDQNTVLKLARNKKGLAQNDLEADISDQGYHGDVIAQVHGHDAEYLWIEAEKARKMKKSEFRAIAGYNFDIFGRVLINEMRKERGHKHGIYFVDADVGRQIYNDDFFEKIMDFIRTYDLLSGDIARLSSWGIVTRSGKDVPVIIDYGVSQDVYKDYYLKKPI
jgi:hypothetical protein